jgi:IS5 family transposase
MASLLYLKHAYKLSDEELVERWAENVVWQHFIGMIFYEPRLPCDATQIGRFRSAIGEAGVEELLKVTIDTAVATKAIKPLEFERVIVDTTVQEKAIAHPVDSRLLETSPPQGGRHGQALRHRLQANLRQRRSTVAAQGWWLRTCQAI